MIQAENILKLFLTVLISIVSFFLLMFYKKVDQIGDDIAYVKTTVAVRDEQIKGIERRIIILEQTIKEITK